MKKAHSFEKSGMQPSSSAGFGGYASAARAFLKALGNKANRPVSALSPKEIQAIVAMVMKAKLRHSAARAKRQGDHAAMLLFTPDLGARVGEVVQLKASDVLLDRVLIWRSGNK